MLSLYTVFHLNLSFSSLDESLRGEVIERCYWPLLRLIDDLDTPVSIEATGRTLEAVAALDPTWIERLRALLAAGRTEFVGSGYTQLIGPLVPASVNRVNLRLGNDVYERLLGVRPAMALVNEQAFSEGLVPHYVQAGFTGIMMEWDNAFRSHPEWSPLWRYYPQYAQGAGGTVIPVVWTKSIPFQKFQRYAHGEFELDEYLDYLASHVRGEDRYFALYANDAEVFDFRPGRFAAEPALSAVSEWARLATLFSRLKGDGRFRFVRPSEVLAALPHPEAGRRLRLGSAQDPVPVKKQGKYNITRWAVTGRGDLTINTACWRLLREAERTDDDEIWRQLCIFWKSDLRTHITAARWQRHMDALGRLAPRLAHPSPRPEWASLVPLDGGPHVVVSREGRMLTVTGDGVKVRLNCLRGLALDALWIEDLDGPPLCGTLSHGYFDDIGYDSDWYSGHVVLETPARPKVTDLAHVEPVVGRLQGRDDVVAVEAQIPTSLGPICKRVLVAPAERTLWLAYRFEWPEVPVGAFRAGNITLHPDAFDPASLRYVTTNGGGPESFALAGTDVDHGAPVSFLVSARGGIGMTDGWVELRDRHHGVRIEVDMAQAAVIGLIRFKEIRSQFLLRCALSLGELDDTKVGPLCLNAPLELTIRMHRLGRLGRNEE